MREDVQIEKLTMLIGLATFPSTLLTAIEPPKTKGESCAAREKGKKLTALHCYNAPNSTAVKADVLAYGASGIMNVPTAGNFTAKGCGHFAVPARTISGSFRSAIGGEETYRLQKLTRNYPSKGCCEVKDFLIFLTAAAAIILVNETADFIGDELIPRNTLLTGAPFPALKGGLLIHALISLP